MQIIEDAYLNEMLGYYTTRYYALLNKSKDIKYTSQEMWDMKLFWLLLELKNKRQEMKDIDTYLSYAADMAGIDE